MTNDHCPGVLRLHEAADGWMARVRLPGGRLPPEALDAIDRVATLGNGVVELTSRASLQVRGLPAAAGELVASRLGIAGLMPSLPHDRVRNILASPVAGRHPRSIAGTDDIVAELDRGLCGDPGLAELPGRFLFAVLDGSGALGAHRADVSLEASLLDGEAAFRLRLAGASTTLTVTPAEAAELVLAAARGFLDLTRADGVDVWGVAALEDGARRLARRLGGDLVESAGFWTSSADDAAVVKAYPLALGALSQPDGRVAITTMPPLGRVDSVMLRGLAACTRRHGGEVRISSRRTVTVIDLPPADSPSVAEELGSLGLTSSPSSGWNGLSACAGKGACVKARVDVRAAAEERAGVRDAGTPAEHWSGCERRCGRPPGSPMSVFAAETGLIVELAGRAQAVATVAEAMELLGGCSPTASLPENAPAGAPA
jgi:sulfite reductase beta subunit-like hemoprotein